MSIDFATLQGLTIPEGTVTQIADAAGNMLWSSWKTSGNVILEVEKITSDTYAGSTTYEDEEFILLDIYPKSGGTVNVTYGGLIKTITDDGTSEEPNAQQVYFGTFNGVSDSVTTPASGMLTIDGDYAAFGCPMFKKNKSGSARCACITGITDFGTVTYIPDSAFGGVTYGGCTKITKVKIPSSVTSIGDSAFGGCTGLTNITIPDSVTSIDDCAFWNCVGLLNATIPDSVTSINKATFYNCISLTSVTIPDSVTSIGDSAFGGCTGLTNITIPDSVTSIGNGAFGGCISLVDIVVGTYNEYYMVENGVLFSKDKTLLHSYPTASGHYTIPSSVTSIGNSAFNRCTGLTSITIPSSVTSIGDSAFRSCTGLTSVTIPSSVTSIGNSAFNSCTGLTSITIPNSVTSIGSSAFASCTSLTSVTIPASVTSIGGSAFYLSSGNTRTVTMLSATPATLGGTSVFDDVGTNNIIVPAGSGATYKAAEYWSEYADYITEAA